KRAITNGYSFWMYSPRRFGKTSLVLKAFETLREKDIITIYFDFYNVLNADDFARKYSQVLVKNLFSWKMGVEKLTRKVAEYFKGLYPKFSIDALGNSTLSFETQNIEHQSEIETILNVPEKIAGNKKICIAFDEFQEIYRIKPFIINWMRSNFQFHKKVSYIFLGSQQSLMEYTFSDTNSPFYEYGFKMNIEPISAEDLTKYIKKQFKKTKQKINDDTIKEILSESRCHPHFTQHFASFVWEMILQDENQENPGFKDKWLNRVIAGQSLIFQNIYDQFSLNQRKTIIAISNLKKNDKLFSGEYRKKFNLPETSSLTATINSLMKKNLVQKLDGSYQIINPVFEEWVRSL
ncbi:MAG TPA: ATP-binding protein, partial [Candidatus Cloacimonetes bacterium]|nr:ATP-binding protein [Candidatus Cloacimonadota bacterium]